MIGCGKIAGDVLRYVAERGKPYGYETEFVEHTSAPLANLKSLCQKVGAAYERIPERARLTEKFLALEENALIVSAGNYYLFPARVLRKENLEVINFHSALLPKYPGRNAQSWAIFARETRTGATWHYVTASVDSGAILAQRKTAITEDTKAWELTRDIMAAARQSIETFFEPLLLKHLEGTPQPKAEEERKIYYSWEMPGNGVCSWRDPAEYVYRLLRAVDYGRSGIFPPVRISLADGTEAVIKGYKKIASASSGDVSVDTKGQKLRLPFGNGTALELSLLFNSTGGTGNGRKSFGDTGGVE